MAFQVDLKSKEQRAADILRTLRVETDFDDVAPGSSLATLIEAIASADQQIAVSALKILENSDLESLEGTALDKRALAIRLPNNQGGYGRIPASQAGGRVTIGSSFQKISSKLYAGKPAPFAGSTRLFLEDASSFTPTGSIYLGRGTASRFEGPVAYLSVTDNGSFWTVELATPLTKGHLLSDLVVLAQGGDRVIAAGTTAQIPGSANLPAVSFTTNATVVIPDGEAEVVAIVTCTQFGEVGNALAGSIKTFASEPFAGATVTNLTSFASGRSTENSEDLRKRIRNYPATLSRGTKTAILAAIQGIDDPETGQTITSANAIEPTEPGESFKVYIDNGQGLEPTFDVVPYQLLLAAASGQERLFRAAKFPITAATIVGAESGPFVLEQGMELTVVADGVTETYTITPNNYVNLTTGTGYELVRDFNSQSNIVGFRTMNGGKNLVMIDLSGRVEELRVLPGELQTLLGFPIVTVRPIFVYKNNQIQSFRGATGTLSTNAFPWGLTAADLFEVPVIVDGVTQVMTVVNTDFAEFSTNIATATLAQWATVLSRKIAGIKFTVSGNVLVWSTYQTNSPTGTVQIPETRADGSAAGWVGDSKMWRSLASGGTLSDAGAEKDFSFNRFTGEIEFVKKPAIGSTIEIGSRTTRAQLATATAPAGLYSFNPLPLTVGNSRIVVGFDGEFAVRPLVVVVGATFTPTIPDPAGASNVVRLFANDDGLFANVQVDDYIYLVKDTVFVPAWGAAVEGIYRLKAVGINGFAVDQNYASLQVNTLSGSDVVTVTQPNHGFKTGARLTITTAAAVGGISGVNLSQVLTNITVLNSSEYTYVAGAAASSTAQGTLATVVYDADTWVEFEVSTPQLADWTPLLGAPQSVSANMIHPFKSAGAIPQIVDFGNVAAVTIDQVVDTINDQVASGTAVKRTPQQLVVRSNDYETGTVGILAIVGNAVNAFTTGVAATIQSHVAFSDSGFAKSGFAVVERVFSPDLPSTGHAWRFYLEVDRTFVDVLNTAANPAIASPAADTEYPVGFEHLWVTGRYAGLTGRVYNNQTTAPFSGIVRGEGAIRPLQTFDTEQTSPQSLDRYSNFGLRMADLSLTNYDRLVVEMDQDPIDKTVAVPMSKRATIQDMDVLAGQGKGQVISFRLKDPEDPDPLNANLPRPFFDAQSVYRDYDFRDFRLLTKSVGVYRDYAAYGMYAAGSLTGIPSGVGGVNDGDTFTLSDGTNPTKTFEFDSNGSVAPGNVAVTFIAGVPSSGTLTAIAAGGAGIADGDTFELDDGVNPAVTFEFDSNGSVTPGNVPVTFIAAVQATGNLTATAADPITGILDGDTFVLDDGVNPAVTFEFDTGGGVAPGNVAVTLGSTTDTSTQVKTAMLLAIAGAAIDITATSGVGDTIDLINDLAGTVGNIAITESFANGVSLFPFGMAGGIDWSTAATIRTNMVAAINGAVLDITASPGAGTNVDLVNDLNGTFGNIAITETLASGTLTPVGMAGGIDDATDTTIATAIITAVNGAAPLNVTASQGAGATANLVNDTAGAFGNIAITETLASGTLTPVGMAGGSTPSLTNRALVLRSVALGSPTRLRLSIRYASIPSQGDLLISHANTFVDESRMTIFATLPTTGVTPGSPLTTGNYTVAITPEGTLYRLTFTAAGLNPAGQYVVGGLLNVGGTSPLAGSYHIVAAGVGSVSVLAPGNGGVTSLTVFSAVAFPLVAFELVDQTWQDLADAINNYLPENPVATAQVLGTNVATNPIKEATYIAYPATTPFVGSSMGEALDHHSFQCKKSGSAGIFVYDSSNPMLNGIQATVQSDDSIFPLPSEVIGTTYTPIDEDVAIAPANSKSLRSWLDFNAASSLTILAASEEIRGSSRIQISSREDGSLGAVRLTGVTANRIESFVSGNASVDQDAMKLNVLATDAQAMVRGQLVRIDNNTTTEILRPYRLLPEGVSETVSNTTEINTFFRPTNSVRYTRLTANTARIVFERFGRFTGQSEPLQPGDTITLAALSGGLVQVTSSGGALVARTGDMMYIKPTTPFAADAECNALPVSGITDGDLPEYLGYPVVQVIDTNNVIVLAPNITTFGVTVLGSETDLVFVPALYNEKNIRTNHAEGAQFNTLVNGGTMYALVKTLGANMVSIFVQNSANETTDTMRLADMLVNTDDYVTIGDGFSLANQGTFRLVAHNGRNHMIVYNENGGKDEIVDVTTLTDGGTGQRKWRVGPITTSERPLRVLDAESVRIGDRLRISTPLTTAQWFPDTMIGNFRILRMGWIGIAQAEGSLTSIAADPLTGIADGDFFVLNDGFTSRTFEFDTSGSVAVGRVAIVIGLTDGSGAVKAAMITAINSLGAAFGITASSGAGDLINLHNRYQTLNGNQVITEFLVNGGTLTPVGMASAAAENGLIEPFIDIEIENAPNAIFDSSGVPVEKFLIAGNDAAIGFVEQANYFGYRIVSGHGVDPLNTEEAELFLQPKNSSGKISETFGSQVTALYKTGFEERTFQGIDGYKVFAGLVREAHRVVDGLPSNSVLYPGVKAMGTVGEFLPPLVRSIQMALQVRPKDGVTLNSISEIVRSTVANYINRLGVGQPVILAEIIRIVQSLPGVYSVTILSTLPVAQDDRIVVSDIESPFVLDAVKDITVG